MAEKFLNQHGLETYNNALQAKIAENYATKEYVNSIAGNAGLTFKIVDRLPGSLISIKDTMGMDLSGKTLVMKLNENMEYIEADIIKTSNYVIKYEQHTTSNSGGSNEPGAF